MHVCDPTVIKMKTKYKGTTYNYVMFYLGCSTTNCKDNRIGIALSDGLSERFIRPDNKLPFTPIIPEGSTIWSTQVQNLADLKQYSDVVWEQVKTIDNKITGYPKNHNCGFIRDSNGYVLGLPKVLATVSTDYLWGYRIKEVK